MEVLPETFKLVVLRNSEGVAESLVSGGEYTTADHFRKAIFVSRSAFPKAANHLRQQQHRLEERA